MADKKEVGKNIFERAMAKLPAEKQETLKALLAEDAVLETIGEHGLMREDYSRLADEAKRLAAESKGVYDANLTWRQEMGAEIAKGKEALSTLERMKAAGLSLDGNAGAGNAGAGAGNAGAGAGSGAGTGNPGAGNGAGAGAGTPSGLTKEEVEKMLRGTESQGLTIMATLTDLGLSHFNEFKEPLKSAEVIALAQKNGTDLNTAYNSLVADRRETTRKKQYEEALAAAEKRGIEKGRAQASAPPYPIGSGDPGGVPTTLSGLTKDATKRAEFGVDAAVRRLNEGRNASRT